VSLGHTAVVLNRTEMRTARAPSSTTTAAAKRREVDKRAARLLLKVLRSLSTEPAPDQLRQKLLAIPDLDSLAQHHHTP
jgi:hypothetical protein